jgi:hypothetical protein
LRTRPLTEQIELNAFKKQSLNTKKLIRHQNTKKEIFVFEEGELVSYTDTRVIHEVDDRLVNLAAEPLKFQ